MGRGGRRLPTRELGRNRAGHELQRFSPNPRSLMLSGSLLHHWLVSGISAVTFIIVLKMLGPHLPDGLQKLIASI